MKLAEKYKYTLCLVSVAAFWSTSYGLSKICQEYANAYTLLTLRFLGAFLITFPILYKSITPLKKRELVCAAKLGTLMFVACLSMVLGVKSTTATNAGFIVGMSVVFVPVILRIVYKVRISANTIVALAMSMAGICLLTLGGEMGFHSGDLLCLVCAVCYASYIVFTGSSLCGLNPVAVGVMQFLFMGLYSAAASLIAGGFTLPTSFVFWSSMAVMVVLGTAYCFIMQVISQQHVSATAAGITLSLEPVFSALFAYVTLGERLGLGQFAGAALMLGGVLWISTREH